MFWAIIDKKAKIKILLQYSANQITKLPCYIKCTTSFTHIYLVQEVYLQARKLPADLGRLNANLVIFENLRSSTI
jgi:hypothetical protein